MVNTGDLIMSPSTIEQEIEIQRLPAIDGTKGPVIGAAHLHFMAIHVAAIIYELYELSLRYANCHT